MRAILDKPKNVPWWTKLIKAFHWPQKIKTHPTLPMILRQIETLNQGVENGNRHTAEVLEQDC